ncbi:MAG: acyl-CoA dehydrogenase family protein [Ignavibacteriales bacterium]|nr:acyl-CoA dehydrogenase family protein [Ignavibacteriales bacterium]MCB9219258.1 acyl-CoA dehydrogenase family protein [Ignavibacteriales bacterium]
MTSKEDLQMLREMVKEFTDAEIRPLAAKIDENEEIPKELINKLAEVGLLGTAFPEEYGGGGFGEYGFCLAQEEVTKACGSTATFIGAHQSIGTNAIYLGGDENLKQKYLPDLTAGKKIAAFALTEPEAGSDAFNLKTTAKFDGNKWILNGQKIWITNGAIADVFSVFARTEKGITGFVVEKDFPGLSVGANEKKLGIKGSATNTITFDNVEIPKENIMGTEGRGFVIAMKTLDAGRIGIGAASLGASKEMLRLSVIFANERKQFEQSISKFQAIQFMIAEMTTKIYAMESMLYKVAQKYDEHKDVMQEAAIVKLYCSEAVSEVADIALQIHGGMGFSRELPIERFYRDARILRIFEGTSEIQKLVISRKTIKNNGEWKI